MRVLIGRIQQASPAGGSRPVTDSTFRSRDDRCSTKSLARPIFLADAGVFGSAARRGVEVGNRLVPHSDRVTPDHALSPADEASAAPSIGIRIFMASARSILSGAHRTHVLISRT